VRRTALRASIVLLLFALAAGGGYLLSSTLGRTLLREELEAQLSKQMRGRCQIGGVQLRIRYGVELVATRVRVDYPPTSSGGPPGSVVAREVVARLDTPHLLVGRLFLDTLDVTGLGLDLHADPEERWSPPYFRKRSDDEKPPEERGEYERFVSWSTDLVATAHFLLEEQQIARHISVQDGWIALDDARPRRDGAPAVHLRLEQIHGRLDRTWLRGRSDVDLRGRLVHGRGESASFEMVGRRMHRDEPLVLSLALSGFDLRAVRPYLPDDVAGRRLAGTFSGVVGITTSETRRGRVELDWEVGDLEAAIPFGRSPLQLASPAVGVRARVDIDPRRLRVEKLEMSGPSLAIGARGTLRRPLRPGSDTTLQVALEGIELDDLRRLAAGLPSADARPLLRLLERVRRADIPAVTARGRLRLRDIGDLFAGRETRLPASLSLGARIRNVTVGTSEYDTLSDLSAEVVWRGDRFELRNTRARFNGDFLPRIDLAVDGVSTLLAAAPDDDRLAGRARPVPGLATLWEVLRDDGDRDPGTPPQPIEVELDALHHPALRWPLRGARIEIDPREPEIEVAIRRGYWAGAPVRGHATVGGDGDDAGLRIELEVSAPDPAGSAAAPPPTHDDPGTWASGRFHSAGVHGSPLRFESVRGGFEMRGQTLLLDDVHADLGGGGTLTGAGSFGLGRADEVPSAVSVDLAGALAGRVAEFFGLAPDFASGRADVQARLRAPLHPGMDLVRELEGHIDVAATNGRIRQTVPLLAAIAHASEGLSPTRASESLRYERIDARIEFERGLVRSDRIALEGPLRVLAVGEIDFRQPDAPVEATVGLFLLRQADRLLGNIPLVNLILPGGHRGLLGAYFQVSGPLDAPRVEAMPMKSLAEGLPLPPVLRAPFDALRGMLGGKPADRARSQPARDDGAAAGSPSPPPAGGGS